VRPATSAAVIYLTGCLVGCFTGCLAGCGRIGFDELLPGHGDVVAIGPLACGSSRTIATLSAVPLGLGLVSTKEGAIAVWGSGVASTALTGVRLGITADEIVSADSLSTTLPHPITDFGLAADGDARYMLSASVPSGALFAPLDSMLAAGALTTEDQAEITSHAVAEPVTAGAAFASAWIEDGEVRFSLRDATGAAVGMTYTNPGGRSVSIRRDPERHVVVWTPTGGGCGVWAFDAAFAPVQPVPLIYVGGGTCLRPAITRNGVDRNLLAWIDNGAARAQIGNDTTMIGPELGFGSSADDLDVVTASSGFFVVVASSDTIGPGYVRGDATGQTAFPTVSHVRGAPFRLVAHEPGALLLSVAGPASQPQLQLTRLCEPSAPARRLH
jgi:hypothetical protein